MANSQRYARPMEWIKSNSGNTWICPKGSIRNRDGASDSELKSKCVNESENPQNN
jgi:hypothetical protein